MSGSGEWLSFDEDSIDHRVALLLGKPVRFHNSKCFKLYSVVFAQFFLAAVTSCDGVYLPVPILKLAYT